MEAVLTFTSLVVAISLFIVWPVSTSLRIAEERSIEPLLALFAGLLLSWVGPVALLAFPAGRDGLAQGQPARPQPSDASRVPFVRESALRRPRFTERRPARPLRSQPRAGSPNHAPRTVDQQTRTRV